MAAAPGAGAAADYRAAGVVFFTRGPAGVRHALLALEERRVSGRQLGAGVGPARRDVVVFPQGRRERKDEGDPVETAMREYHEETGNFGALTRHLLRFYEEDGGAEGAGGGGAAAAAAGEPAPAARKGAGAGADSSCGQGQGQGQGQSFVMYFSHARMIVVFCEVPTEAYERSLHPLSRADLLADVQQAEAADPPPPAQKRLKKDNSQSYHVGKENHLTPVWVSADALRGAVTSLDDGAAGVRRSADIEVTVCPRQSLDGTGHIGMTEPGASGGVSRLVPFFPLNLSVFRQREARIWLGLPAVAEAEVQTQGALGSSEKSC